MCVIVYSSESLLQRSISPHILRIKRFIAKRERVSYVFSNRTANLALRAIIDCNISRAACATQHSTYLCDLPRAILKRYLSRRNKLIYLSIYLRSESLRMRARALTFCIMYRASARIIFRCWYVWASKITAMCSLPTRRVSSSRHCMLRPFATRGLVATGNRTMLPEGEHGHSPCVEYVKHLCFSICEKKNIVILIRSPKNKKKPWEQNCIIGDWNIIIR